VKPHFILYVRHQDRSSAFYRAVLEAEPVLHVAGMTEFDLGGAVLGLMPIDGIRTLLGTSLGDAQRAAGAPCAELYLYVTDPAACHARAVAHGARELSPLQRRNWGHTVAYSMDPDGYVLAFVNAAAGAGAGEGPGAGGDPGSDASPGVR
jgi:uncharacterized protein